MTLFNGRDILTAAGVSLAVLLAVNLAGCNEPQQHAQAVDTSAPTTDIADATNYATLAADEVQHALNYADLQGVAVTTVYYCSSPAPLTTDTGNGSISVTVNRADTTKPSVNDSYTTTYNQCVQFGRTLNGTSKFTIAALTGVPFSLAPAIWSIATIAESDMTITSTTSSRTEKSKYTFSNGSTDGVTYTKIAEGTSSGSVTRGPVTAPVTTTQSSNFKMTLADNHNTNLYTHTMSVGRKTDTRDVLIDTPTPLVGKLGTFGTAPDSGSIKVTRTTVATATTPATKSITTITVTTGGNARVDVDSNGDGVIDSTSTVTWRVAILSLFF